VVVRKQALFYTVVDACQGKKKTVVDEDGDDDDDDDEEDLKASESSN